MAGLVALALCLAMAAPTRAQAPGNCATGQAQALLDVNEVRASVFNTGSLSYGGTTTSGNGYVVPKATGKSPLFAAGLWVGGKVNGELRFAGARYGNWNFWPGPLDDGARPVNPDDCSAYDRIYSVSRADIDAYEAGGAPTPDLADWPVHLGAPVIDGDGDDGNYSLAGRDRPDIIGDQAAWWVMNDVGNVHPSSDATAPIGLEVSVLAYAFARADGLGSSTFYQYTLHYRGAARLDSAYVTFFVDTDLGDAGDDYVGSDSTLGLGYSYNADNDDGTRVGYGIPPAFGVDILRGASVDGRDLGASVFVNLRNAIGSCNGGVSVPTYHRFQKGLWCDGSPMRAYGYGYHEAPVWPVTTFAFDGDPVTGAGWSEVAPGPGLQANAPGDRYSILSSGPFTMSPGDTQEITIAMIFAQGADNLDSVTELKRVDGVVQNAFDDGFQFGVGPPPPPRCVETEPGSGLCAEAIAGDGQLELIWGYPAESPAYLGRFSALDPLLRGGLAQDSTYELEGFNVYAYPNRHRIDRERTLIATFDRVNGVMEIRDDVYNGEVGGVRPAIVMRGSDSGLRYSMTVDGLFNHSDYHYAVTAFSYNEASTPKVVESAPTYLSGRPEQPSGGAADRSASGDPLPVATVVRVGTGEVRAEVAAPRSISGDTYEVRFHHPTDASGAEIESVTTYSVVSTTSGATVMDGQAFYEATGEVHPTGGVIRVIDGFVLSVEPGAVAGDIYRIETAGAAPASATDESRRAALDDIQIVPNPYLGRSGYDVSADSRVVRFINLPDDAVTIRVFTVAGTLVKTLEKTAGESRDLDWDLTTQVNVPAASGMYLIQVQVHGIGERLLKFGLVQRSPNPSIY